jgi:hypothetical protein
LSVRSEAAFRLAEALGRPAERPAGFERAVELGLERAEAPDLERAVDFARREAPDFEPPDLLAMKFLLVAGV